MLVAVLLPVLLGVAGLAVDNGLLYAEKRGLQTASDAAALAAAHEWRNQNFSGYADVAREDAARNGFEADDDVEIDVNVPPLSGPRAGDANFVEIVIRKEMPLLFMRAFSDEPVILESRAVAGLVPSDPCIYVLDPHASNALAAVGTANISLDGCAIRVNSDHSTAARTTGGGTISASAVGIVGDYSGNGFYPTPQTGIYPAEDPMADLEPPPATGCTHTEQVVIKEKNQILNPGVYCGGIKVTAQGEATFNSGVYVLKGGLNIHAGADVAGDEVMFYNTEGSGYSYEPIDFHSNSTAVFSAPTSGDFKGVLFFQDRDVTSSDDNVFAGKPSTSFTGILYFPTTDVKYVGGASTVAQETMLVARRVEVRGNATLKMFSEDSDLLPTALAIARVVE